MFGTRKRKTTPACGANCLDLLQFIQIVVSDQRFVGIERLKGFLGLGRIGVDDFVPDKILLPLGPQAADVLINRHEFRQRCHVEAGASPIERPNDFRSGIGLNRVVSLHLWQVLFELRVVLPNDVVTDDHQRRSVFARELL